MNGRDLPLVGIEQRLFDIVHGVLQHLIRHRPLFAGPHHPVQQLLTVERFTRLILFHHHKRHGLHDLVGGEPFLTYKTLPAAADAFSVVSRPGIDHFGVYLTAIRTFHGHCSFSEPDATEHPA